jgi:DNA-binding CsgD family transcriptional regulator
LAPGIEHSVLRILRVLAALEATPEGGITFATEKARELLAKYLRDPDRIPQAIVGELTSSFRGKAAVVAPCLTRQLYVRMCGREDGCLQLLLEERDTKTSIERLRNALSLTPREAEVLLWITEGKTNSEIASILGCRTATINKHAERIFAKLSVETRTAAAATAREVHE